MVLSKYDLISPSPYYMDGVGHVKAIKLSEIDALFDKVATYDAYTAIVSGNASTYVKLFKLEDADEKTAYEILTHYREITNWALLAYNFFFTEEVVYLDDAKQFVLYDKESDSVTGYITAKNFEEVSSVILQRCALSGGDRKAEEPKFKNEKARRNYEKMYGKTPKDYADRENYDLGNIIAHLAAKGDGLNILNIWDMSVYNVYDQFMIARKLEAHEVTATSLAVWGDKENKIDLDSWYKK